MTAPDPLEDVRTSQSTGNSVNADKIENSTIVQGENNRVGGPYSAVGEHITLNQYFSKGAMPVADDSEPRKAQNSPSSEEVVEESESRPKSPRRRWIVPATVVAIGAAGIAYVLVFLTKWPRGNTGCDDLAVPPIGREVEHERPTQDASRSREGNSSEVTRDVANAMPIQEDELEVTAASRVDEKMVVSPAVIASGARLTEYSGRVLHNDHAQNPVPNANVTMILGNRTNTHTRIPDDGQFRLSFPAVGTMMKATLIVSCDGYVTATTSVEVSKLSTGECKVFLTRRE